MDREEKKKTNYDFVMGGDRKETAREKNSKTDGIE